MQMLLMVKKQLKLLFRNRIAILVTISVPIILAYLFSFSQGISTEQKLYVSDSDNSVYSNQLIDMIKTHKDVAVINSTEAEIKKKIDAQEISMGFVIDKNFGENLLSGKALKVKILQNYENGESLILEQIISGEISTFKKVMLDSKYISDQLNSDNSALPSQLLSNIKNSSNISIEDKNLSSGDKTQNPATVSLIGFLVMFIWFVVIQGFRTLLEENENNVYDRLLSTPINYNKYLISKIIATYIFGGLHIIAILLAGKYLLKISIVNNLFAVCLVFAAYLLLLTSITAILVLFIKKQQNFTVSTAILVTVTGMLGGCFFSLELAPKYMQIISKFTPEAWAIQALKDVIFKNASVNSQIVPLTLFIGVGILGLIISSVLVNKKTKFKKFI